MAALKQKAGQSIKHAIIDKANTTMLISVSVAVFAVVFCGFAVKALVSQSLYQQRIISEKKTALSTLENNREKAEDLKVLYESFATESVNVLGGNPEGTDALDGDNAKIVLDALPSEYDYPALSSSLEKILLDGSYQIESIGGSEDGSQSTTESVGTITTIEPAPIDIPYPFSIETTPEGALGLLNTLERSIRPFSVQSLSISGRSDNLSVTIGVKTFFQPASGLKVTSKEVR